MADTKKRLPVLKQTPEEEQGQDPRPPWHWVGFGTCVTMLVWLPLAYVGEAVKKRIVAGVVGDFGSPEEMVEKLDALGSGDRTRLVVAALVVMILPLILGALAGGFVVGRWGGDNAGVREAAIGGFAAAGVAIVLTLASGAGVSWLAVVLAPLAAGMAALGGKLGLARRIKAMTPNIR